ncbi:RBBP9/YdeN family alpha/beta hydrolase [Rivibacter subsaxonicus]|uniref:Alpha/beta hydrolase n=1 Tax=Rivibacter subsaxonicus TaxID=457575 RepID=A0A4Q7VWV9_9BURK|nr:alpha/beta hydrolase [Rivibacter subsaxonicus]RZU00938.1 hypothetical protein EV670_1651 [Rivibacter subsaxonicus]
MHSAGRVRLLIVPGLHGSGPDHWQSRLQARSPGALRVEQADWSVADMARWSARIEAALASDQRAQWIAVAHSFGCLALAHHGLLAVGRSRLRGALLVAPADPRRFGCEDQLPAGALPFPSLLVGSRNDPWLRFEDARGFARRWGSGFIDLGAAGHVNPASGYGAWPGIARLVERERQRLAALERPQRASALEWDFAV